MVYVGSRKDLVGDIDVLGGAPPVPREAVELGRYGERS